MTFTPIARLLACIVLLFTVTVRIPMQGKQKFKNVVEVVPFEYYYELRFANGKSVFVPVMWTIVEEE